MTSSGTGAGVLDRKRKGAPRGMEVLLMLFHVTILARIKRTLADIFQFRHPGIPYPPAMPFAIRQPFRHLFPCPYAIYIVKPHHPPLLLRQSVNPAFRVLACLCKFQRFRGGTASVVRKLRNNAGHTVMVVRSGWHAGEDRGQPLCPCAQLHRLFIQLPDLVAQEAQAV